jgi:hypothetical protein
VELAEVAVRQEHQGTSGSSGSSGSSGTSGSSGSSGTSGSSGSSGTSGSSGSSGTSGSSGSSGTSGSSGSSGTSGSSGSSGTSGSSGSSGTSGSSGSSGTSGSSGSSGTSGSSGSSGTSGKAECNQYKPQLNSTPNANGEIGFGGSITNASQIQIYNVNSDSVDYTEYYEMIAERNLAFTLTITQVNDTDNYVIYEVEAQGVTFNGTVLTLVPSSVFASPLVDAGTMDGSNVCIDFDLFRGVKTLQETGINSTDNTFFQVKQADYDGMIVDYVIRKTDATPGTRTGTIMAAWDGATSTVQYTDTSTRDAGGSTAGLTFRVTANGTLASLGITVTSGTYNVTISVRPLGEG